MTWECTRFLGNNQITFFEACFSGDETKLIVMVIKPSKLLVILLIIMINMRSKKKNNLFSGNPGDEKNLHNFFN